jgi:hypothetical protein
MCKSVIAGSKAIKHLPLQRWPRIFHRLRKHCFFAGRLTSAAEAGIEDEPVIAAVNRCATQN